jgi:hypothetical protein
VPNASREAEKMCAFIDGSGRLFVRDEDTQQALLAVPACDVERVVLAHHNGVPGGHRAAATTLERIARAYWWRGMAADVERVIRECRVCNATMPWRVQSDLGSFPVPPKLEVVHFDIKPMPEAESGETAALIGVDAATGFMTVSTLMAQKGAELSRAIENDWYLRHGPPRLQISDNEGALVGKDVKALAEAYGVEVAPVAPHNPAANGLAESGVHAWSTIVRKLLVGKSIKNWASMAQAAVHAYNTALSAPRKASPFKLMFGVDASSPAMRKDGLHHGVGLAPEALAVHAEATSKELMAQAEASRAARHVVDVKRVQARAPQVSLVVGDAVWLHNVAKAEGSKVANMQTHLGPFTVVRKDPSGATRYQLAVRATGRVVAWRGVGRNVSEPRWFAARLLTKVENARTLDVAAESTGGAPHAFQWQGVADRTLLPLAEQIAQVRADADEKVRSSKAVASVAAQTALAKVAEVVSHKLEEVARVEVEQVIESASAGGDPISGLPATDVEEDGIRVLGMRGDNVIVHFAGDPADVTTALSARDFPDLAARAKAAASSARADRVGGRSKLRMRSHR